MIKQLKYFLAFFSLLFFVNTGSSQPRYGDEAIEIALPSLNGDTLKLSSLKGKVVLLDFWASWCGPCRSANRGLAKLYSRYKEKGFEIYSVSMDLDFSDWQKAVKKDKITWQQVNDNGGKNSIVARQWNIYALPTSFVMDKDGRLIAMDLPEKELEKLLKKLL